MVTITHKVISPAGVALDSRVSVVFSLVAGKNPTTHLDRQLVTSIKVAVGYDGNVSADLIAQSDIIPSNSYYKIETFVDGRLVDNSRINFVMPDVGPVSLLSVRLLDTEDLPDYNVLDSHAISTTAVHGITDTSLLVYNADLGSYVLQTEYDSYVSNAASSVQTLTNKTMDDFSNLITADRLHVRIRNDSGGVMAKGSPVYISGYNNGQNIVLVGLADGTDVTTMPCIGILENEVINNQDGDVVISGRVSGVDTVIWDVGDDLYVSSAAGVLTSVQPVGVSVEQKVARVLRSHASLGIIEVTSLGTDSPVANTALRGVVELATDAEVVTGTDTARAVTPASVKLVLDTHAADTTDVHGIADTSLLETATGAQSKADAAQTAAETTASTALTAHGTDTTAAHGIADTADLVVTSDSRLTDSRTPTVHAASHASGGTDALTPADIGLTDNLSLTSVLQRRRNIIFWDGPDRADGALGTSESGHVWETNATYPWYINGGKFKPSYPGYLSVEGWALVDCLTLNPVDEQRGFRIGATSEAAAWAHGLIVAWQSEGNFVLVCLSSTGFRVIKCVAGVFTDVASSTNPGSAFYPGEVHHYWAYVNRNIHQVTIMGETAAGPLSARADFTGTDAEAFFSPTNTKVGLYNQHPEARIYDMWLEEGRNDS